jgi:hypothetical protein
LWDTTLYHHDHVVVTLDEDYNHSRVVGNSNAAYINSLAGSGLTFAQYYAVSHPSELNYFALFSGSSRGVTDDRSYHFSAPTHTQTSRPVHRSAQTLTNAPRSCPLSCC